MSEGTPILNEGAPQAPAPVSSDTFFSFIDPSTLSKKEEVATQPIPSQPISTESASVQSAPTLPPIEIALVPAAPQVALTPVTPQTTPIASQENPAAPPANSVTPPSAQDTKPSSIPVAPAQQPISPVLAGNPMSETTEILPGITASAAPIGSGVKTPKNPVTPAQIMRIIGGLFFVALIFFGSFLAYIVFNPEQARFFISFGINPADIATLLVKLVNGIFGSLTAGLSILFMYFLFRWYITKGAPKKRVVYVLLSLVSGIVLFSNIGFWAYLFSVIGASDFVRPSGGIIVYDNDLLLSDKFKKNAEL